MTPSTRPIRGFFAEFRYLSNFYFCRIPYEGIVYPTTEHAFQAAKTLDPVIRQQMADIARPQDVKIAGRTVPLRGDWERVKEEVMLDILRIKFADPTLRSYLVASGEAYLEETNTWGDRYWGVCDEVGKNRLGHLLMQVRGEIVNPLF